MWQKLIITALFAVWAVQDRQRSSYYYIISEKKNKASSMSETDRPPWSLRHFRIRFAAPITTRPFFFFSP